MFSNLSEKLNSAFHVLKGHGKITEINIAETLKEVRRALLDADVNFKIAKDFTNKVKEKAIGRNVLTDLHPGQLMVKIVKDELTELMGGNQSGINLSSDPSIILLAGLQGSGKTTFSGKLANYLKKKKQLKLLGNQIDVPVYSEEDNKDAVSIAKNALKYAEQNNYNLIIYDTAGRLAVDEVLMNEIKNLKVITNPSEILFVVDSMTGQDAVNTAKAFNDILNFDGVILTKLDGDTRGGAALTIRSVVEKPIKFVGTGEKLEDLDVFYPERMADRILGMGDVVSLVERAQDVYDEKKSRELNKKIAKNKFGFDDFLNQINQVKKMGNLKDTLSMIPVKIWILTMILLNISKP